jgi:DNA polymerase-1
MTVKSLYLIDGSSYLFRAYHALPPLTTSHGLPTGAVYGFTAMLFKILRNKHPDAVVVVFDPPGPTERHERFAEYKANRAEMPEELARQIPYIHRVVEAMRIPLLVQPGQEADDLLGSLSGQAGAAGWQVTIVTSDKDMLQLVGPRVQVYDSMKEKVYGEREVTERLGVSPDQVVEMMGLMGDPIDNIPGVRGIGEKTARSLVQEFGTIEAMLARLHEVKSSKVRQLLSEQADRARLSRDLALIRTDLGVGLDLDRLALGSPDEAALRALFRELEFTGLQGAFAAPASSGSVRVVGPDRKEEFDQIAGALLASGDVALGVVASEGGPAHGRPFGLAMCAEPGVAACLVPESAGLEALDRLGPVLAAERPTKTGHDLKQAIILLHRRGIQVDGAAFDTMVASYLLNPNRSDHSLDVVALEQLGVRTQVGAGGSGMHDSSKELMERAAEEASMARDLRSVLAPKLEAAALVPLFEAIEMPLVEVLASMELAGFRVDADQLREFGKELEVQLGQLESRIFVLAGGRFNIQSPKQLAEVLFQRLQLKPIKRTKTGYSTDMDVLQQLARSHELPAEVLNFRSLSKLKSTYVDVLPELVDPRTGRIHTSFNQTVTATGRLSSSEPNLQNIPVRTEVGRRIRQAFIAEDGHRLLSADYSQIELRILAHLSEDQALIAGFSAGDDVHRRTASEIFAVPPQEVTAEMRRRAKAINFGIIYGMSPFGLASDLGISQEEAALYIGRYFQIYQGVKAFIDRTIQETRERGFVTTIWGRRRAIPELQSSNPAVRQLGERLAVNSPIQGSAADLIKLAMIGIFRRLKTEDLRTRMILQIHDELLFEVPEAELPAARAVATQEMERAASLKVGLSIDIGVGRSWAEAHGH